MSDLLEKLNSTDLRKHIVCLQKEIYKLRSNCINTYRQLVSNVVLLDEIEMAIRETREAQNNSPLEQGGMYMVEAVRSVIAKHKVK